MGKRALNLPLVLLAGALVAAGIMTLVLTRDMTFFQDTWDYLIGRREITLDTVLTPHNEHIVAIPVLIEQVLLRLFGMGDARPEYVLLTIALLGTASLLFVYLRRRVGPWLALFGAILVLFLGPAWEVLLWPFELTFVGAVFFGLAALLALEREDRRGDVAACLFLVVAVGFSTLGLPFLAGAAAAILVGPADRWLRRAYIVVVPALLFLAWYAGWGHEAQTHLSLENALASPRYIADALAANVESATGLAPNPFDGPVATTWGWPILVALVAVLVVRQVRHPGFSPRFWPVAATALVNWLLVALNQIPGRPPDAGRYQYIGVILLLMVVAALFDGARPGRRTVALAGVLTALAVAPNLVLLTDGADALDEQTVLTRADTAALEIARDTVDPGFQLLDEVAGTPSLPNVSAGPYLEGVDEYGSPAYTQAELEAAPEAGRFQADVVLANALPIDKATQPGGFSAVAPPGCRTLPAGEKPEVALAPGTTRIEVAPGPEASLSLRRFAEGEYPVDTEGAPGGSTTELTIPADRSPLPWQLLVEAEQPVRVCR